jgi:hypothetical protein
MGQWTRAELQAAHDNYVDAALNGRLPLNSGFNGLGGAPWHLGSPGPAGGGRYA